MLEIVAVTITIGQTRPHTPSIFRSRRMLAAIVFLIASIARNIYISSGVGQVCAEVDFRFELVA
jgi:hypothetical protein